ncbi:hypothetical protein A2U01_0047896, partial [Trifolium medium]|nr:hypothetical protein [Trifolium medium]
GQGSSSHRDDNRDINSNSIWLESRGINPDLNQLEKNEIRGFEFHALGLDPVELASETDKKEISLVLGLGSSPNLIENRGINPGSNRVDNKGINPNLNQLEKNEIRGFKFHALGLDPVKP